MRSALCVFLIGLAAVGCATPQRPVVDPRSASAITTTTTTTTPEEPPVDGVGSLGPADDSEVEAAAPPLGLITPTGVVVSVLDEVADGYRVLTPCGSEVVVGWGTPIGDVDIILDPGHGGDEVGAQGENGLPESELNLDLAIRTARQLERQGFSVALTRTSDYRVPIPVRTQLAASLGAEALVSVHHNGPNANPSTTPGTEVYVARGSQPSARLGGLIHAEVVDELSQFDVEWSAASDAGVLEVINSEGEDAYGIVRQAAMPVALVELGYLSNPPEAELFATDTYLAAAAEALTAGVAAWFDDPEALGTVFVEQRAFDPGGTGGFEGCEDPALG